MFHLCVTRIGPNVPGVRGPRVHGDAKLRIRLSSMANAIPNVNGRQTWFGIIVRV
jgi:hypothetical protein